MVFKVFKHKIGIQNSHNWFGLEHHWGNKTMIWVLGCLKGF